jgi:hypothetical protein
MELVTAFVEGPACFLIVWGLLQRKPWRYVAVILVSLGQFYGDVLYFLTCWHEGGRPAVVAGELRRAALLAGPCQGHRGCSAPPAAAAPAGPAASHAPPSAQHYRPRCPGWDKHARPEFLYFWFYFVIINAIWLVVPSMCIAWAASRVNAAVARWVPTEHGAPASVLQRQPLPPPAGCFRHTDAERDEKLQGLLWLCCSLTLRDLPPTPHPLLQR